MVQPRRRVSYIIPSPSESTSSHAETHLGFNPYFSPPPPRLQLPPLGVSRLGVPGPLLIPHPSNNNDTRSNTNAHSQFQSADENYTQQHQHPRHRLGVACLALDTSTQLVGKSAPEGILYTGGRDGLVISWDLGVPMKRRVVPPSSPSSFSFSPASSPPSLPASASASVRSTSSSDGVDIPSGRRKKQRRRTARWEVLTGWEDDAADSDAEEEGHVQAGSDGDVLGDVVSSLDRRRGRRGRAGLGIGIGIGGGGGGGGRDGAGQGEGGEGGEDDEIPYEMRWETDLAAFQPGTRTRFRQCSQAHTDWVNDILLCNYNQTLVSASSDGTVKAWSPHLSTPTDPVKIGMHADYVRCLAYCREQHWVASGSFDRTIKLWDLSRSASSSSPSPPSTSFPPGPSSSSSPSPTPPKPLVTLSPPDPASPKSSIYALAADPSGRLLASGGPERVVRLWDPRSGKRTAKLVGHTDVIRAVVGSEDGKYLLTGSADASIKLWSLQTQKCLHTFTHHTDSVWALFSSHPSLEVFYSGDRSGLVCRVDVEGVGVGPETVVGGYAGYAGDGGEGGGWAGGVGRGDVGEGECVLLCNDSLVSEASGGGEDGTAQAQGGAGGKGINKLLVMDDNLLWTASGTSSVRRWCIPQRRSVRMAAAAASMTMADGVLGGGGGGETFDTAEGERADEDTRGREQRRRGASVPIPGQAQASTSTTSSIAATPPESTSRPSTEQGHGHHGHSNSNSLSISHPHPHSLAHAHVHNHSHSQSLSLSHPHTHSRRMSASPSLHSLASELRDVPSPGYLSPPLVSGAGIGAGPSSGLGPSGGAGGGAGGGVVGIPYESLVRLVSPNEPFAFGLGGGGGFGPSVSGYGYGSYGYGYGNAGSGGYGGGGGGGYATTRSRDPEVATLYSAASVMSVPRHAATSTSRPPVQGVFPTSTSGRMNNSRTEDTIMLSATRAPSPSASRSQLYPPYPLPDLQPSLTSPPGPITHPLTQLQLPDLANDATPLLLTPESVIPGSHGLVRSVILNDRVHALTVDTAGVVGVWDIVRGACRGFWGRGDVLGALGVVEDESGDEAEEKVVVVSEDEAGGKEKGKGKGADPASAQVRQTHQAQAQSPREALEAVRARIEGEGVAATWCAADTKGGVLTIHLGERCFEAEVFADEVGFGGGAGAGAGGGGEGGNGGNGQGQEFGEEFKLNIGKWVLRNLFIGFIQEELRLHPQSSSSGQGQQQQHAQGRPHTPQFQQQQQQSGRPHTPQLQQERQPYARPHTPQLQQQQQQQYQQNLQRQQHQQHQRNVSRTPSRDTLEGNVIHSRYPTITPANAASPTPAATDPNSSSSTTSATTSSTSTIISSPTMIPAVQPSVPAPIRSSPLITPLIPLHVLSRESVGVLPAIPQSPITAPAAAGGLVGSNDATPTPGTAHVPPSSFQLPGVGLLHQRTRSGTVDGSMGVSTTPTPLATSGLVTAGLITPGTGLGGKEDYFSLRTRRPSVTHPIAGGVPATPADDFSGWSGPGSKPDAGQPYNQQPQTPLPLPTPTPQTPSTPSGLMSRLKSFGKITKRPVSDVPNIPASSALTTPAAETPGHQLSSGADVPHPPPPPNAVQKILQSGELLSPPTSLDAPLHMLPPNTTVLISEEAQPSYNVLFRREVGRMHEDIEKLEEAMPSWLAEYLLHGRTPPVAPLAKISFVLMPWNKDPDVEPLPELLNTQQSKLTASRYLRVKKIVYHVHDKLERIALTTGTRSGTNSIRSSMEGHAPGQHQHPHQHQQHHHDKPRPEDEYEILCNDVVLPLGMSLAAVRQYVWRQGTELVMHYRRKRDANGGGGVGAVNSGLGTRAHM